jgi:hypothetical protein
MPQEIGQSYKSVIPTFADGSSIEEAFYMYHYGNANWSPGQSIPSNSIEGIFSSLDLRITENENFIENLGDTYITRSPSSSSRNTIQATSSTIVPLTIRGAVGQTANLQEWVEDTGSSQIVRARISANGSFSTLGYFSVGSISPSPSVANSIQISSPEHKGVVVRSSLSQTANLQEWQDSNENILLSVDSGGSFVYNIPVENVDTSVPENVVINQSKVGKTIIVTNLSESSVFTITIPSNSTTPMSVGSQINYISKGVQGIQFSPASGVTLNSENGYRRVDGEYSAATLIKVSTNEWILLGALRQ